MAKEETGGRLQRAKEYTQEKYENVKGRTEDSIKEKPFTSVAIAAGIGAVIGAGVALGVAALVGRRERSFSEKLRDLF
jgi:ElaB/YqjD/DUF883 family membrane-anchored ribosome-binding protein